VSPTAFDHPRSASIVVSISASFNHPIRARINTTTTAHTLLCCFLIGQLDVRGSHETMMLPILHIARSVESSRLRLVSALELCVRSRESREQGVRTRARRTRVLFCA
jgi:hypothetical protein